MSFLALDLTRLIVAGQAAFLMGLITIRTWQQWQIRKHDLWWLAPNLSWFLIIIIGFIDSLLNLGEPNIELWRSIIRGIGYAIGIGGLTFRIKRTNANNQILNQVSDYE